VLLLSCMAVCGPRYCCPARQAVRCICMYYMLVRLSVSLNHIKGTITIIINCNRSSSSIIITSVVQNVAVYYKPMSFPGLNADFSVLYQSCFLPRYLLPSNTYIFLHNDAHLVQEITAYCTDMSIIQYMAAQKNTDTQSIQLTVF